ncbi:MAG: alpha/beta hydrolase [Bacteroidota bacterium]
MNQSHFVKTDGHCLHYRTFGSGSAPFLYFHGFGENAEEFSPPHSWRAQYRFYAFDLFYHGRSEGDRTPMTLKRWREIFKVFIQQERIKKHSITIAGYSMGGRFALATLVVLPDYIRQAFLVAPDGIYRSFWYRLALSFQPVFHYLMSHPTHFEQILRWVEKWKLASTSLVKFSRKELGPVEHRMRVYYCWTLFRPLGLPKRQLIRQLNKAAVPIRVFLGTKDYIIPVREVLPTMKKVKTTTSHILPTRHHEIVAATWDLLLDLENTN